MKHPTIKETRDSVEVEIVAAKIDANPLKGPYTPHDWGVCEVEELPWEEFGHLFKKNEENKHAEEE